MGQNLHIMAFLSPKYYEFALAVIVIESIAPDDTPSITTVNCLSVVVGLALTINVLPRKWAAEGIPNDEGYCTAV